jgi:hypothetical protein
MYAPANLKENIAVGRWMGRIVVGLSEVALYMTSEMWAHLQAATPSKIICMQVIGVYGSSTSSPPNSL